MTDSGLSGQTAGRSERYVVKRAGSFLWRNLILFVVPLVLAVSLVVISVPAWQMVLVIGGCVYAAAWWMFVRLLLGPDEIMIFDERGLFHRGFFKSPIPWSEIDRLEYAVEGHARTLRVFSAGLRRHLRSDAILLGPLLLIWFGGFHSPRGRHVSLGFADLNATPIEAYNAARRIAPLEAPFQANHARMLEVKRRTRRNAKKKTTTRTKGGRQ